MSRRGRKSSWLFESRDVIGSSEDLTSLLELVVRINLHPICKRSQDNFCFKSAREADESTGTDSVGGSPRPGNDVIRTLMVL